MTIGTYIKNNLKHYTVQINILPRKISSKFGHNKDFCIILIKCNAKFCLISWTCL